MQFQRIGRLAVATACALTLVACGGGGGSPSSVGETPMVSSMLGITTSNYQAVGQAVVSSALFLGDTGDLVTGAETGADPRLLRQAVNAARRGLAAANGRPVLVTGAEVRDVVPCTQGGSLAMTLNDANNNSVMDVGDSITMDAQSCKEDGTVMQGRLAMSVQSMTGVFASSNYSATLTMTMTAFSVSNGSDSSQGDGALSLTLTETAAGVSEVTLSTTLLTMTERVAGVTSSTTLSDVKLTARTETVTGTLRTTVSITGTLASSGFGNRQVTLTTPQPLMIVGSDPYPRSGQLLARGSGNSAVRITVLNATQVRLELDADGDGSYETQVTKSWTELQ